VHNLLRVRALKLRSVLTKKVLIVLLLTAMIPVAVAAPLIVSNIFRGSVEKIALPENLVINEVIMPETITIGSPFTMYINVTNPNDFTVNVRLYINFTLIGATEVTKDSMSYLKDNNFTYTGGCTEYSYECWTDPENLTWCFVTPYRYDGYYIQIPPGTHVYYIVFQLNTQCTKLEYAVWFQTE